MNKKNMLDTVKLVRVIVMLTITLSIHQESSAQCDTITDWTVTDWCENQFAQWEINTPESGVLYHWYEITFDAMGDPIDTIDRGYGDNGVGTVFTSPFRYTTPIPEPITPGWDDRTFFYISEIDQGDLQPYLAQQVIYDDDHYYQEVADVNTDYSVDIVLTEEIFLESVDIPVRDVQGNNMYEIQINIPGVGGGPIIQYTQGDLNLLNGQDGLITVPVNLTIPAGSHTVFALGNPSTTGGVNNSRFRTFQDDSRTIYSNYVDGQGILDVTPVEREQNSGQYYYTPFFDWDYTAFCSLRESPAAVRTSDPAVCCTPILSSVSGTIDNPIIVSGIDNATITLTAFEDIGNYFQWYDALGIEISGGIGMTTFLTDQAGSYFVREVEDQADLDNISCFAQQTFLIQERAIFASLIDPNPEPASYCIGDEVTLEVTGADIINVEWSPASLVDDPNATEVRSILTVEGASLNYLVSADIVVDNLIVNGDFELGGLNPSITELRLATGQNPNSSEYGIYEYVPGTQGFWNASGDQNEIDAPDQCRHDGNMMVVDGFDPGNSSDIIWEQSVNVSQNQDFTFSFDHTNISWDGPSSDPRVADADVSFDIYINDVLIGQYSTDGNGEVDGVCRWVSDTLTWNSSTNSTADISIRQNLNGFTGTDGRDFAIDNIRFGGFETQTDIVTVGPIENCFEVIASQEPCVGDSIELSAVAINTVTMLEEGSIDRWEELISGDTVGLGSPIFVKPNTTTDYVVFGKFPAGDLAQNGDYELGPNGFLSGNADGYFNESGSGLGRFEVINSTEQLCGGACFNPGDFSPNPGAGQMLFVDARGSATSYDENNVIGYEFDAIAGENYIFKLAIASAVFYDPDTVQEVKIEPFVSFNIEGPSQPLTILNSLELPRNNDWQELEFVFTAPADGIFTLNINAEDDASLIARQTTSHPTNGITGGNDFVIDKLEILNTLPDFYTDTIQVIPCGAPFIVFDSCANTLDGKGYEVNLNVFEDSLTSNLPDPPLLADGWFPTKDTVAGDELTGAALDVLFRSMESQSVIEPVDTFWLKTDNGVGGKAVTYVTGIVYERPIATTVDTVKLCEGDTIELPSITFEDLLSAPNTDMSDFTFYPIDYLVDGDSLTTAQSTNFAPLGDTSVVVFFQNPITDTVCRDIDTIEVLVDTIGAELIGVDTMFCSTDSTFSFQIRGTEGAMVTYRIIDISDPTNPVTTSTSVTLNTIIAPPSGLSTDYTHGVTQTFIAPADGVYHVVLEDITSPSGNCSCSEATP